MTDFVNKWDMAHKTTKNEFKKNNILNVTKNAYTAYTISNSYTLDSALSFSVTEIETEIELAKRPSNKHHNVKCHQP